MRIRCSLLLPALFVIAGAASAQPSTQKWSPLPMDPPRLAKSAALLGPKAPTDALHISVGLPYANEQAMQRFVDDVSNPSSPNYRKFITPEEVGRRFGLPAASVKKVSDYLVGQGMKIRLVAKNRLSILADATVAQAEAAFHTTIQDYSQVDPVRHTSVVRFAFTVVPSVPASIRSLVTMIGGLENFTRPHPQGTLTPAQLQTLYGVAPGYGNGFKGQGRTVAISNWDGYRLSNIPLEYQQYSLPTPSGGAGSNVTVVPVDGEDGNTSTYAGEGDIDIQCVLAMAPLCNLIVYDNANESDYVGVVSQEADDNLADIVTESYGWSPDTSLFAQVHAIHLSMSAQGITYLCASGDTGAEGVPQAPYPDEDPEILVVGGTSVSVEGTGARDSEVVWNDSSGAGGGGWSANSDPWNVLPSWQKGNGVPTNINYRLVPDIVLDADPYTGYNIFMGGQLESGWGGTSCASPTCAGSLADSEQQIIAGGGLPANASGKRRFGRIQDLLYSLNGDPTVFFDVVSGTIGTLPNGSQSNAAPGWDTASGWGAPMFNGLVNKVLGIPTLTGMTVSPTSIVGGAPATGNVTINLPAPSGGFVVNLASNSPSASVPATIKISAGASSGTFTINTTGSTSSEIVTLTGTAQGVTASAVLTVQPTGLLGISVSPGTVVGGNYALGTATLSGAAPPGGFDISLSSNNSNAIVPQHAEIAAGATSGTFSVATSAVSSQVTATITGTLGANGATGTVTVGPAAFSGFSVAPTSVVGGTTVTGTVSMNGNAGSGGLIVNLASNNSAAAVPSTVTIPAGASSATFSITTSAVATSTAVTVTASQGGTSVPAQLTITPATLSTVAVMPGSVIGGSPATGTVTLTGPAGGSGITVKLASNNANVIVPASVLVPAGASTGTFVASTTAVSTTATATITATQGSNSPTASLTVNAPALAGLSVAPGAVGGGSAATGTVTLNGPAGAGGIIVSLSSNSSSATVPGSVMVAAGAGSAAFKISTSAVPSSVAATIIATQGSNTQTATLSVNPPSLAGLTLSPASVVGGTSSTGTVTLNGVAPAGGVSVSLSSSSASAAVPGTVVVPAGASSASFAITSTVVNASVTATISATQAGVTASATLAVLTPLLQGVSITPATVYGGTVAGGSVSLARVAPAGGVVIGLASNSASASVPSTVTVASGATTATFSVATSGVSTQTAASVTATLANVSTTASLTLQPAALANVSVSPTSVEGGATSVGTVALIGFAPAGGAQISLASNSTAAMVPSAVKIAAGASSATFNVTTKAVAIAAQATITATYAGASQTTVLTLQPASLTIVATSLGEVIGGSTTAVTGTVLLGGLATSAGATVELTSSDTKVVSVPASVRIAAGASSATFKVTHLVVANHQSVTLTASYGGVTKTTMLAVDPFQFTSVTFAPSSVLGGKTSTGTVTLNAAPGSSAGALSVKLSSSVTSAVVPAAVAVPVNSMTGKFTVTTKAVATTTAAGITAKLGSASSYAALTITAAGLTSITVSPSSVAGGAASPITGTVTLSGPAPAGGAVVSLSSSSASATTPSTVTVAAGRTSATFRVGHTSVAERTSATITASLAGTSKTATLNLTP